MNLSEGQNTKNIRKWRSSEFTPNSEIRRYWLANLNITSHSAKKVSQALAELEKNDQFHPLQLQITLKNNRIESSGCLYLAKVNLKHLHLLVLSDNMIGDRGCKHLSKGRWDNLKRLNLSNNGIGDAGCRHLSKGCWKQLQYLELYQNDFIRKGKEYLFAARLYF